MSTAPPLSPEIMVQDAGEPTPAKTTALLAGPGGLADMHRRPVRERTDLARVLDSAALPDDPDAMDGNDDTILTPHRGEFERLFGAVSSNAIDGAVDAARRCGCIVVLKGPMTVIASPQDDPIINDRPNPALATAGTGDVLAGIIAGLVAQGMVPRLAAAAGVWLHLEAADAVGPGLIASDLGRAVGSSLAAFR
ncbi:ADP/ATP-dependent (S)-NAD(P)H-hydrate dehydratase [uncultured Algimonas sp.]|uniref:ADP-dependent NAD(P)H-hydrate dehydratase n=1 Tax=uncultured Algimonas sp. TaxID=1547920 RepID=UPI0026030BAE|nr:ADP/ATP-dependent (S)-NAD(P)H-hydrate dehydratase [uncultured Algimonas sp.]